MEYYFIPIAIFGGFFAGIINTFAGNGSAITLSILTELVGLPGNIANGTNRVGLLAQSLASNYSFYKHGKLKFERSSLIIICMLIGAFLGVYTATNVSNEQFMSVFKFMMIFMLFVILINPKRWLINTDYNHQISNWIKIPAFLLLGFYGGFIQMGMGIFFLAVMVLLAKYSIVESNAIKVFIVGFYTLIIIWVFHYQGMVEWKIGGTIAIGQTAGGYYAANFMSKYENANLWAYRLLVLIVILVILKQFNLFAYF